MGLKIYEIDPVKHLSAPGLAWKAAFKKYQSKIRYCNWYQYVINDKKGITGGICHSVYWYAKADYKYMKDYGKNIESSYLQYWDVNKLYGWEMSQKLPVNNFEWIEDTCS